MCFTEKPDCICAICAVHNIFVCYFTETRSGCSLVMGSCSIIKQPKDPRRTCKFHKPFGSSELKIGIFEKTSLSVRLLDEEEEEEDDIGVKWIIVIIWN